MIKKFLPFLILMVGCTPKAVAPPVEVPPGIVLSEVKATLPRSTNDAGDLREFEYDGCQYIILGSWRCQAIAHKGNCKYCLERQKGQK